ncbi:MAG: DUF2341 domain-containing protein [Candidatus Aenigmatarchaeota archaeon]
MRSDCGDVRFANSTGDEIPYWIETGCNNVNGTLIWVKVPNIPAAGANISMYYGNPAAMNRSSGDDTFIFFDDFSNPSNAINSTKWDTSTFGSPIVTVSNGLLRQYGSHHVISSKTTYTTNVSVEGMYMFKDTGATAPRDRFKGLADGQFEYGLFSTAVSDFQVYFNTFMLKYVRVSTWNRQVSVRINSTTLTFITFVNTSAAPYPNTGAYTPAAGTHYNQSVGDPDGTMSGNITTDWIFIRKWYNSAKEPVPTQRAEENSSTYQSSSQWYDTATGIWSANCTVPVGLSGAQNLFVSANATSYAGGTANDTETGAVVYPGAGTPNVISVALNAPTSDPSIFGSQTFSMNCTPTTGGATIGVNISYEYNSSTMAWKAIETAGGQNITISANPKADVLNGIMKSENVTGNLQGTYNVRCKLYNSSASVYSATQQVTVKGVEAYSVSLDQPTTNLNTYVDSTFTMACTANTSGAAAGVNITYEYNSSTFGWTKIPTSGTANLTVVTNPETDVQNNSQQNETVTTRTANTYNIRCNANSSTTSVYSLTRQVVVNPHTFTLNITYPTQGNPVSVTDGQNITVNYTFTRDGTNVTSGVSVTNITVGGQTCQLQSSGSGGTYLQRTTITNSLGFALTNYQVNITVNTSALIAAGKMRSDCGDIRFFNSSNAEIDHWIESGCNTTGTRIWVEVPNIPAAGTENLVMYYGNMSHAYGSSGNDTFILFDDFNSFIYSENQTIYNNVRAAADNVISLDHTTFTDGTDYWQAAPGYVFAYAADIGLTMIGYPEYFNASHVNNTISKFMNAANAGGEMPISLATNGAAASYYSGYDSWHLHAGGDAQFLMPQLARLYYNKTGDISVFNTGYRVKLINALKTVQMNSTTGLVYVAPASPWVPFGFRDGVLNTGNNLLGSLMYYKASVDMAYLLNISGDSQNYTYFTNAANNVRGNISRLWNDTDNMFHAADGANNLTDIVGSAFAVHLGVANASQASYIEDYLANNFNSITYKGFVLQTPNNWSTPLFSTYDDGYWSFGNDWILTTLAVKNASLAYNLTLQLSNSTNPDVEYWAKNGSQGFDTNLESPMGTLRYILDNPQIYDGGSYNNSLYNTTGGIDHAKWVVISNNTSVATVSDGLLNQYSAGGAFHQINSTKTFAPNISIERRVMFTGIIPDMRIRSKAHGADVPTDYGVFDNRQIFVGGAGTGYYMPSGLWTHEVQKINATNITWYFYNDTYSIFSTVFAENINSTGLRYYQSVGDPSSWGSGNMTTDWIFVRKWYGTEPASTTGAEEGTYATYDSATGTWSVACTVPVGLSGAKNLFVLANATSYSGGTANDTETGAVFYIGSPTVYSVSLDQPATDTITYPGSTFTIACTAITNGASTGNNISYEYNSSTFGWTAIPTSGTWNITLVTNPETNVLNNTQRSETVTAHDLNTYNIRCRAYNSTDSVYSSERQVTVTSWWNSNYTYQKNISISNSLPVNLTDYQVNVSIDTATLISAGQMNTSCLDARFVNSTYGLLSHWLWSGTCNSPTTTFVVKVPLIWANTTTYITMYYGNMLAENVSSGNATFIFFDDFQGASDTSLNVTHFSRYASNPVMNITYPGAPYDNRGIREVDILQIIDNVTYEKTFQENGTYTMFYTSEGTVSGDEWYESMATSTDLYNWTRMGLVTQNFSSAPWNSLTRSSAYVFKYNGTYYMYYMGSNTTTDAATYNAPKPAYWVEMATTTNVSNISSWVQYAGNPVIVPTAGTPYSYHVICDELLRDPSNSSQWLLFCGGSDPTIVRIVYFKSTDLFHWTYAGLASGTLTWEENPKIIKAIDNNYYMVTNHINYTGEHTDANFLYRNASADLSSWTYQGSIINRSTSGWDSGSIGVAGLIYENGVLTLLYDGGPNQTHGGRQVGITKNGNLTVDNSKWTAGNGSWTIELTGGSYRGKLTSSGVNDTLYANIGISDNYTIEGTVGRTADSGQAGYNFRYANQSNFFASYLNYPGDIIGIFGTLNSVSGAYNVSTAKTLGANNYYYEGLSVSGSNFTLNVNGTSMTGYNSNLTTSTKAGLWGSNAGQTWWDDFRVRKYIYPEPTVSIVQSQAATYIFSDLAGSNTTTPSAWSGVKLYANWSTNATSLNYYWLETNESGTWRNQTATAFGAGTWSNITWFNDSVAGNTVVGWKIHANNSDGGKNATSVSTFTVQSSILITLTTDTVAFGNMSTGTVNDTADDKPLPFEIRNDGNIKANITINATNMFTISPNPSSAYRAAANTSTEGTTYNTLCTNTSWFYMPVSGGTPPQFICFLDWLNATDQIETEIAIAVPNSEPSGAKTSTVTFIATMA